MYELLLYHRYRYIYTSGSDSVTVSLSDIEVKRDYVTLFSIVESLRERERFCVYKLLLYHRDRYIYIHQVQIQSQ